MNADTCGTAEFTATGKQHVGQLIVFTAVLRHMCAIQLSNLKVICTLHMHTLQPYPLPGGKPATIDVSAQVDSATQRVHIVGEGGNVAHLMSLVTDQLQDLYNITFPSLAQPITGFGTLAKSASVAMSSSMITGITVPLNLAGSVNNLASALGINFAVPDNILTISDPSLVYSVSPVSLAVQLVVSIPVLKVQGVRGALEISSDQSAAVVVSERGGCTHVAAQSVHTHASQLWHCWQLAAGSASRLNPSGAWLLQAN